jgi:iron uptake system EfeUOB component EfeO/EfeM
LKIYINSSGDRNDKNACGYYSEYKEQTSFEVVEVLLFDFNDMISFKCLDHEYDVDPEHLQGEITSCLEELAKLKGI